MCELFREDRNENDIITLIDSLLFSWERTSSYDAIRRIVYSIPLPTRKNVIEDDVSYSITSLMMAAARGQTDIVELLLLEGANPDAKNILGVTAFTYVREDGIMYHILRAFSGARWLGRVFYGTLVNDTPTLNVRWDVIKELMLSGYKVDEEAVRYMKSRDHEAFEYILNFNRHITLSDMAYHSIKFMN